MICVYASDCTDFSNNGLGPVQPQSCTVTETLNGEWELTLVHPIDDMGRWMRLTEGRILRAPVPAAMTPQMSLVTQQYQTTTYDVPIYRVSTQRDPLRLRSGTGTNYKILGKYKKGTEIIVVDKTTSSWYEVTCPDGKHGYMSAEYLTYVRTETQSTQTNVGFRNEVIESRQLRDQPFRIYRIVPELDKVTVYARHVFYDLLDNMIQKIEPSASVVGASVAQSISSNCLSAHDFTFYSDLTTTAEDVCFENINPVEAMLGEGGIVEKYGAELARDWFDVFLVKRVGHDTDVHIRERKNLTGISYDVDETDVVTRIMPTGEDADGNILYLPELYVDSPNIGSYVHPKWIHLPVSEAKEVAGGENYKSLTECYQEMRNAARAEYERGCDLPTVTLKVDFINCADTVEYAQYAALSNIFLGDSIRVIARRIGVEVSMRMTQYTYDCLTRKYTSVTLGTVADTLEGSMVSARQLASGSITGAKLALNSVGTGQLQSGSVGSLQIKNAAIGSAHIQDASITRAHIAEALIDVLNVNALTAVTAKIKELVAGSITSDELYTSIAMIATAQLTTANIVNAKIEWAQIENLAAEIASISKTQITTATINEANINWAAITTLSAAVASMVKADIGTADIDWAHIKDLATDTAIITQGVGGELYIAKLAVTEANLVSLTVGELVVKGTDGHFYSVSVDADGNITSTLKQVGNDDMQDVSINAGEKIIEGTITAATLNVNDIFADSAIIRSLIAANLDVDTLFAREATVNALNALDITSNTYLKLMVSGKADKSDVNVLDERMGAAELKLTPEAIVSTVTDSQQYKDDLAAISLTASGPEFIVGTQTTTTATWTGDASFSELKDGQQITYWLPFGGGSNVTLNLTLKDGTETGAIPCYYSQGQRLGTQYAADNVLHLTYRENAIFFTTTIPKGWWADANYNSDTYDRICSGSVLIKENLTAFRFLVGTLLFQHRRERLYHGSQRGLVHRKRQITRIRLESESAAGDEDSTMLGCKFLRVCQLNAVVRTSNIGNIAINKGLCGHLDLVIRDGDANIIEQHIRSAQLIHDVTIGCAESIEICCVSNLGIDLNSLGGKLLRVFLQVILIVGHQHHSETLIGEFFCHTVSQPFSSTHNNNGLFHRKAPPLGIDFNSRTFLPAVAQIICPCNDEPCAKAEQPIPPDNGMPKQRTVSEQIGGQHPHAQRADCHDGCRASVLCSLKYAEQGDVQGQDVVDAIRDDIIRENREIKIVDFDKYYDISTFNLCEQQGYLMETIGIWAKLHPSLVTIPVKWKYKMPYGILYAKKPSDTVKSFVTLIAKAMAKRI